MPLPSRNRGTPRSRLALLTLVASACLGGGDSSGTWVTDTLPGGTIHTVNTGPGLWGGEPEWRFGLEAKIGDSMEEGPASFVDVADIEVDGFGRVWVLDRKASELRLFGPDGSFIRAIGRFGRGPGELNGAQGMMFDRASRLWVMNQSNGRYTLFDTAGTLLKELPRRPTSVLTAGWAGIFDPTGQLWDIKFVFGDGPPAFGFAAYDSVSGELVEPLLPITLPDAPPMWLVQNDAPNGWWAGSAAEYRLMLVGFEGDTIRVVERPDFLPLRSLRPDSASRSPIKPTMGASGYPEEPDHLRTIAALIQDDTGHLWVLRWLPRDSTGSVLDAFDPAGRYLGEVRVPYRLESQPQPILRGGRLYSVVKDEFDVQSVVVLNLNGTFQNP